MKALLLGLVVSLLVPALLFFGLQPERVISSAPQEFIGSQACITCHAETDLSSAGYNIWEEANKTAHPFAATVANPTFPAGTNDAGLMPPPGNPDWSAFPYVLGGYAWKATYIRADGYQHTTDAFAQYNLEDGSWVPYHPGETLKFDVECSQCHMTGVTEAGSWNGNPSDSLGSWNELGVQCEGCHGPSSDHVTRRFSTSEGELRVLQERCGDCHNNGGKDAPIPASNGFAINHAQYQELEGSRHGSLGFFTCATCHEPHLPLRFSEIAGKDFNGRPLNPIRRMCQDCHTTTVSNHPEPTTCVDCHMAPASKSAVGITYDNGGARGDVASHIWRIGVDASPRDSMFTMDGAFLKPGPSGWYTLTLDFACLGCHTDSDETLEWAAHYAATIHADGTAIEDPATSAAAVRIGNYPNPFSDRTTITYRLDEPAQVELRIYTANGQDLGVIEEGQQPAGTHEVVWDGRREGPLASGMYVLRLTAGAQVATHRLLLVH